MTKLTEKNEAIAKMIGYVSPGLNFNSDANLLMDAISFIQKKNYNIIFAPFIDDEIGELSGEYWCQILSNNSVNISTNCIIDITGQPSNQAAIFEALYQFSQYFKYF